MLFDSHAHYNDSQFDGDRFEILDAMEKNGIGYIVNAADSMESIEKILPLAEKYRFIYAAVGVHPEECENLTEADIEKLKEFAKHKKVCAIGEIGLDYHYDDVERTIQQKWFDRQLSLAEDVNLPVIIHDREAHADCIEIIKKHDIKRIGGVLHCYSGSPEMAKELLPTGIYFGVGGTLTFKNAKKVRLSAEAIPIDRILLETDCPYLAPEQVRGKRNSSLFMHYVAEKLAEIKGISVSEVEKITTENAKRLYRIED
ncbi:MAG: TatD family hydrolase [Clostridia bacterium]|nr:TatD family hydrolase [Clostridia bacterium]MBQ7751685.1 TatD family hydrolase [Clostridia bacterium]